MPRTLCSLPNNSQSELINNQLPIEHEIYLSAYKCISTIN